MAKISPVSIKYMIHANFYAEGALERPDIIGALFGQTEGLLGSELEMRELQKEGKIGRIEVDTERKEKKTIGVIKIPTALDQSETTLIAAAIETIDRIGPSDANIEVERIEDVRGSKRDYIIDRAKKLMREVHGSADSREISNEIKSYSRTADVQEYGKDKLPAGDISGKEVIVVEGRADVLNLMKNGVRNVIAMNGTKLPETIRELSREKDLTLFVDGDRGGRLIARNVVDNARVKYIAIAPEGKEVEELYGKEIWANLRKKVPVEEFFSGKQFSEKHFEEKKSKITQEVQKEVVEDDSEVHEEPDTVDEEVKEGIKKMAENIRDSERAVVLNRNLEEIKNVSAKSISTSLKNLKDKPYAIIIDGTVTPAIIKSAESAGCRVVMGKNFSTTDTDMELMSL